MKFIKILTSILFLGLIVSCNNDEETPHVNIDVEFEEYVERFKTEADNRGIQINYQLISLIL